MEFTTETVHMASIVLFLVLCQVGKGDGCSGVCTCCLNDKFGIGVEVGVKGWYNVCLDGCKDGYHQARCMKTCPQNCQTCKQAHGECLTCKPGFYGIQNDFLNNCSYPNCACGRTDCDFCLDGFYKRDRFCTLACS
ncbi:scavenger receptor class F member 2-like [Mya arenaria]|uniref:scavenger receptor class F member 2-like n=1 Tax=Mya arenaria TaxID=6604 RepID=UPI0022E988AF|nr:scavenger receptor class F member 2-like [Mya arenaria]